MLTVTARALFVQLAKEQLGKPVLWAQRGPEAFDCSGLVTWLLEQVGGAKLRATHNAQKLHDQTPALETFPEATGALPGDLCLYGPDAGHIIHVTIWLEGGACISADGATSRQLLMSEALKNPLARVCRHDSLKYRRDFRSVHRNTWLDAVDGVCR